MPPHRKKLRTSPGRRLLLLLIIFAASGFVTAQVHALSITRGPYLQHVSPTGVAVLWWTDIPATSTVRYGLESPSTSAQNGRLVTRHRVVLPDLPAATAHIYAVTSTAGTEVVTSGSFTFWTAPEQTAGEFRFGVLGSTGTAHVTQALADDLELSNPAFVLHVGDLYDSSAPQANVDADFLRPAHKLLASRPWFGVLGDKEYPGGEPSQTPAAALDLFDAIAGERNYSFDYGAAHFVGLDSFAMSTNGWQLTAAEHTWLEDDLAANQDQPWTIVALHHPLFSTAANTDRPWQTPLRESLVPLFEEYGVDYVLAGHDTLYCRSNRGGTTYVVSGGGGLPLTGISTLPSSVNPHHYRQAAQTFHSLVFDVSPNQIRLQVRDAAGRIIDREAKSNLRRNVILFIGDGMGFEQVQAGRLWANGSDATSLTFESRNHFPYHGTVVTALPDGEATDSAAAGTAMATGYQHPFSGIISEARNVAKTSILELARDNGQRTGIVTNTDIVDATVASFAAHDDSRHDEKDLLDDYLMDDTTDALGASHARTLPNVVFGGGWGSGLVTPRYLGKAQEVGYAVAATRSELFQLNLDSLDPPLVLGIFDLSTEDGLLMSEYDRVQDTFPGHDEPDLAELTIRALDLLEEDSNGFFLVVENEHIDEIGHNHPPDRERRIGPEVAGLDRAVRAAVDWVARTDEAGNTLILVGSDHETGNLRVEDGQEILPGTNPMLEFRSTSHALKNVPLYATWPVDLDGQTIDNTEIFFLMEDYLFGGLAPAINDLVVKGTPDTTTVTWNTEDHSSSRLEYGLDTNYGQTLEHPELTREHEFVLTDLNPATMYYFRVTSRDRIGLEETSTERTFSTAGPPPRAPTAVGIAETDAITVSWSPNLAPTTAGYGVYRAEDREGPYHRLDTARREVLIDTGAFWRFEDKGLDQGKSWRLRDFIDSQWPSGPAPLGYGNQDEATLLSFGDDPEQRHITYYFRHLFQVPLSFEFDRLELTLQGDDSAVVYLNGLEVTRSNLPPSTITYRTRAAEPGMNTDEFIVSELPLSLLDSGENLIAVEVHQLDRRSATTRFDLSLKGFPKAAVEGNRYADLTAPAADELFYAVTTIDRFGQESALSVEGCVSLGAPGAPFQLSSQTSDEGVELQWSSQNECDLTSFRIYRSTTPTRPSELLATISADALRFIDATITPFETYSYQVTAVDNDLKESPRSSTLAVPVGGRQRPGDCTQDGVLNLSDPICILNALFSASSDQEGFRLPCADRSASHPANRRLLDFNGDNRAAVDITDALASLSFLFLSGAPHPLGSSCLLILGCPDNERCP